MLRAPATSAGRDKFDVRWMERVWLGVKTESGEPLIGASERRSREGERLGGNLRTEAVGASDFDRLKGVGGGRIREQKEALS